MLTARHKVELHRHEPQGTQPGRPLLDLVVTEPSGGAADVLTDMPRPTNRRPPGMPAFGSGGGYDGPLAYRMGKPMRPDVARLDIDRLAAAARGEAGLFLSIMSATAPSPSRPCCGPVSPSLHCWCRAKHGLQ
jgi:hypothetical protein